MKKILVIAGLAFFILAASAFAGITLFSVSQITDSSAVLTWVTDMDATTELNICELIGGSCIMTRLPAVGPIGTSHQYLLSGLKASAAYRVDAISYDETMGSNMTCDDGSSPLEFTTLAAPTPVPTFTPVPEPTSTPVIEPTATPDGKDNNKDGEKEKKNKDK